jgi:hypothetical protein
MSARSHPRQGSSRATGARTSTPNINQAMLCVRTRTQNAGRRRNSSPPQTPTIPPERHYPTQHACRCPPSETHTGHSSAIVKRGPILHHLPRPRQTQHACANSRCVPDGRTRPASTSHQKAVELLQSGTLPRPPRAHYLRVRLHLRRENSARVGGTHDEAHQKAVNNWPGAPLIRGRHNSPLLGKPTPRACPSSRSLRLAP